MTRRLVKRQHWYDALLSLVFALFTGDASATTTFMGGVILVVLMVIIIAALAFVSQSLHP